MADSEEDLDWDCSLLTYACSTSKPVTNDAVEYGRPLELSDLNHIQYGHDNSAKLEATFGKPNRIVPISHLQDLWVYRDRDGQRATFVLENPSGKVLSSALLLRDSDPIHDLQSAKSYFRDTKFSIQDEGWVARHELSSESSYIDWESGITLDVNKTNQTVMMVGFGIPKNFPAGDPRNRNLGSSR